MSHRSMIEEKVAKKTLELQALEEKLKSARVYLQALADVLRAMDSDEVASDGSDTVLRKGSIVDSVREVILSTGRPMHIDELVAAAGRSATRENKASFSGSLAAYVRRNEIFTRPAPNTYGLVELNHFEQVPVVPQPPTGFGLEGAPNMDDEIPF